MRIIYKSFIIFVISAVLSISLYATNTHVVFVNGIKNTFDEAEKSREVLEKKLNDHGVCKKESDCYVWKFYNKTHGSFDDFNELEEVKNHERAGRKVAWENLKRKIIEGYEDYKKYSEVLGVDISYYEEKDEYLLSEFSNLSYLSVNVIGGFNHIDGINIQEIRDFLIDQLPMLDRPLARYTSSFLFFMKEKEDSYRESFRNDWLLSTYNSYFSDKDSYGNEAKAIVAITKSVEGLISFLEHNILRNGNKCVVVAHSQGNHIIELAYAGLEKKYGTSAMKAIQVVGVASVAGISPSETYLTWDGDNVVLTYYAAGIGGIPLPPNFQVEDRSPVNDTNNHGFVDVYMNNKFEGRYDPDGRGNINEDMQTYIDNDIEYPVDEWIIGLIKGSMEEAVAYTIPQLKKTGQTTSYLDFDDAFYKKGIAHSYTRDDTKEIVTDHITGLQWQDDTRSIEKPWVTQANYDAGNYTNTSGDTAMTYCADLSLGGYSDWRLPTRKELGGIVNYEHHLPSISIDFIKTAHSIYWSSTPGVYLSSNTWAVSFGGGTQGSYGKDTVASVRCVRTGE